MTFLDAAIEILRRADGPMHFGEIARRAVDSNLLSHVGRDPEAAMRSCLNSAVRAGREGGDSLIVRSKPGHYGLRPGAKLPDLPSSLEAEAAPEAAESEAAPEAAESEAAPEAAESEAAPEAAKSEVAPEAAKSEEERVPAAATRRRTKRTSRTAARRGTEAAGTEDAGVTRKRRRRERTTARGEAPPPESVEVMPSRKEPEPEPAQVKAVEFEAPSGSGLDGVTDVELVMANAMSRLAEERPELREELEAMQQTQSPPVVEQRSRGEAPSTKEERSAPEERPGRRKRRRRRRARRVDWSGATRGARPTSGTLTETLLESVASALDEAGPRSLHVRQIAEALASKGILGGEISEIERAVTSAVLLDVHTHGRASRFSARGDARYQLRGTRLPEPAAKAEQALREAVRTLEAETGAQLVQWLQTLGARALESLVRVYLQREGFSLLATLPPSRGLGKLVAEDRESEEDEGRVLVLVVPKRTSLEPKLWDGEIERNKCNTLMVFTMGEVPENVALGDVRCVQASEMAGWLRERGLGVEKVRFEVSVLDPTLIESIGGLDT